MADGMADGVDIATFYRFARLSNAVAWQQPLRALCEQNGLKGTLLLTPEGVNGTLAGRGRAAGEAVLAWLGAQAELGPISARWTVAARAPFRRMRVRTQAEIVGIGAPLFPAPGRYVAPAAWPALMDRPGTLLLDVRNRYEVASGRFAGAHSPGIESFAEFPAYADRLDPGEHPRVAMYCTGGIRCEKAATYLTRRGFGEVYQLAGGILAYLQAMPRGDDRWQGDCFVFDERERLDDTLRPAPRRGGGGHAAHNH